MRRRGLEVPPAAERGLDGARGSPRSLVAGDARDPRPGQDGAHVGERVAPGVVVDGSDEDEVGVGRARGIAAARDQRGRGSALAGGPQRELGDALVPPSREIAMEMPPERGSRAACRAPGAPRPGPRAPRGGTSR